MPVPDPSVDPIDFTGRPAEVISGAIRGSGLVSEGDRGVVLVSGGADSIALLLGLRAVLSPGRLTALHVNYGLRDSADHDEKVVNRLCERSGIRLLTHRAGAPEGNVQAWARAVRLDLAEKARMDEGADWIAVGHNRSDQVETFLYRLVASPGVRPLLAMPPRSGHLIRPLISLDRELIRELLDGSVEYAEDPTNLDSSYARNRIRLEVLPELEKVGPAAEANIARTRAELVEDEQAILGIALTALGDVESESESGVPGTLISAQAPAVRRRMIRHLAESELGRPVAVSRDLAAAVARLSAEPEGGRLDLGGGDFLLIEAGRVRAVSGGGTGGDLIPGQIEVGSGEGSVAFGAWAIEVSRRTEDEVRPEFGDPWKAFLDLGELESSGSVPATEARGKLQLRAWRSGDRVDPLGMSGSKSLQDVFTDALVPASRRRTWPVLTFGGIVVWVPGLVRSRHLLVAGPNRSVLRLEALPPFSVLGTESP